MHAMRALDTNAQLSGTKVNALVALLALRMLARLYRTRACLFAVLVSARHMLDDCCAIQKFYRETKKMPNEVLICP